MLAASVNCADFRPNALLTAAWLTSIHRCRTPAIRWCRKAQISASATSLMNQPGKNQRPALKAALNLAKEYSEVTEVSNIQMMNGISANIRMPLMRCMPDTIDARGHRYAGRSLNA